MQHLGMRLSQLGAGEARISMPLTQALRQYQGLAHGGAIASLADTAATIAALTALPRESDVVTVEFKMNYLSALRSGRAVAHGRVVCMGSRIVTVEVAVSSPRQSENAAIGLFTMLRIPTR